MKIAFASDGKTLEDDLSAHFGMCPYYLFVTVTGGKIESVEAEENPFLQKHEPGAVPQFIAERKADVIISGGMGPKAIEWFKKLGIRAVTTKTRKISAVLKDYLKNKVSEAEPCESHKD